MLRGFNPSPGPVFSSPSTPLPTPTAHSPRHFPVPPSPPRSTASDGTSLATRSYPKTALPSAVPVPTVSPNARLSHHRDPPCAKPPSLRVRLVVVGLLVGTTAVVFRREGRATGRGCGRRRRIREVRCSGRPGGREGCGRLLYALLERPRGDTPSSQAVRTLRRMPLAQEADHRLALLPEGSCCLHSVCRRVQHLVVTAGVYRFRRTFVDERATVPGRFNRELEAGGAPLLGSILAPAGADIPRPIPRKAEGSPRSLPNRVHTSTPISKYQTMP